ncbi:MAG: hypothetical protein GX038_00370 [Erysipelothrix sp.]|nr:hypothetical protein [Erysipelothrix sp.]
MTKKSTYDNLRSKDGAALVTVIVVFLTLVIIVTSATMVAHGNFQRAKKSNDHSSSFYIAEAGLNKYYDHFLEYFEINKTAAYFDQDFADDFLRNFTLNVDEAIVDNYGLIMNESTKSEFTLEYLGKEDEKDVFRFVSKGFVGKTSRIVESKVFVDKTSVSANYSPDSIINLDPNPDTPMMWGQAIRLSGPIITNKRIESKGAIYTGPLITSSDITFTAGSKWKDTDPKASSKEAVIITSAGVNIDNNASNEIKTIVLKADGYINATRSGNINSLNVQYVLIPSGKAPDGFFRVAGQASNDFKNSLLSKGTRIIEYDPVDFNPYETEDMDSSIVRYIEDIFGKEPIDENGMRYDYSDFFKSSFILDNLDSVDIDDFLPTVVMPKQPDSSKMYPYGALTVPEYKLGDVNVITQENELKYASTHWSLYADGGLVLDLTDPSITKKGSRFFKSIEIGAPNEALKIDIGSRNIVLVTEKLTWGSHLEVIGTGTLKIYVIGELDQGSQKRIINKNNFKANVASVHLMEEKNGPKLNESHRVQLIVYETSGSDLLEFQTTNLGGTKSVGMSVFSDNLNLKSNGYLNGSFISSKGEMVYLGNNGGTAESNLVFAPKAELHIAGGPFKGIAVTESTTFGSNGSFIYNTEIDKSLVDEILSEILVPGSGGENTLLGSLFDGVTKEVDE